MRSTSVVPLTMPEDENTPEQNELIARLRATLPDCIAKHPEPQGKNGLLSLLIFLFRCVSGANLAAEFKKLVDEFCDDRCLRRYLRGLMWNYDAAVASLHASLAWRFKTAPAKPCDMVRAARQPQR